MEIVLGGGARILHEINEDIWGREGVIVPPRRHRDNTERLTVISDNGRRMRARQKL